MKQILITRMLCCVTVSLLAPLLCFGQSNYARLNGTVFDPQQQVVPGASLRLTSLTTEAIRQGVSNEHGAYQITGLLPGEYTLTAEAGALADPVLRAPPWEQHPPQTVLLRQLRSLPLHASGAHDRHSAN